MTFQPGDSLDLSDLIAFADSGRVITFTDYSYPANSTFQKSYSDLYRYFGYTIRPVRDAVE